jgi:hypothetical protein
MHACTINSTTEATLPPQAQRKEDRSMTTSQGSQSCRSTGTNTGAKTPRGKAYKGQPKTSGPKTPVNSEGLTLKQEAFTLAILSGKGWSDAYRDAYDAENMSAASVHREAFALATSPKIASRLERAERERQAEQRMQRLSRAERVVEKLEQIALRVATPTAHKCGHWSFWARRWGCSSIALKPRTRRHEMLMRCGPNWKHG